MFFLVWWNLSHLYDRAVTSLVLLKTQVCFIHSLYSWLFRLSLFTLPTLDILFLHIYFSFYIVLMKLFPFSVSFLWPCLRHFVCNFLRLFSFKCFSSNFWFFWLSDIVFLYAELILLLLLAAVKRLLLFILYFQSLSWCIEAMLNDG